MSNSLCIQAQPTTLLVSETIGSGQLAVLYGTFNIPQGFTLTVSGTGQVVITNIISTG